MTNREIAINIRLALLNLGRDHKVKIVGNKTQLSEMLKSLRTEQREKGLIK